MSASLGDQNTLQDRVWGKAGSDAELAKGYAGYLMGDNVGWPLSLVIKGNQHAS